MKTLIYEIGVIDKDGEKHPVRFKKGLNVVTGKSSTGKSALIEIFDYCFGSSENTIPKGVITDKASIYYVALFVNDRAMVIARMVDNPNKAFLKNIDIFSPKLIQADYFDLRHFIPLSDFKKVLGSAFKLDIVDSDTSYFAKERRGKNKGGATIRSFSSFTLQHQNLIANKHALFYRFDEKIKRDEVLEHIKYYLGLVNQEYFLLSQEKDRLEFLIKGLKRQQEANRVASESYKNKIAPELRQLYAMMGFEYDEASFQEELKIILLNPPDAKEKIDEKIISEKINYSSDAVTQRYNQLKIEQNQKSVELRKLYRKEASIKKHILEEARFVDNVSHFTSPKTVHTATMFCPFCHTEKDSLQGSAKKLEQAIIKVSTNLVQMRPMKAKFESSLVEVKREIEVVDQELTSLSRQITEIENTEKKIEDQKNIYESILMQKAKLLMLLDTLGLAEDVDLDKQIVEKQSELSVINKNLGKYNIKKGLDDAEAKVNQYMAYIGKNFEFESSYQPINLHFSFETFDLYHLTPNGEKIYLRSMGSGANWLYSHVALFLALHKYFVELGDKCSIPSVLFFDQPTQVYFPSFNRDNYESFDAQKKQEIEQRKSFASGPDANVQQQVDEDIKAVENLFSQLSIYCNEIEEKYGFCPQIIVTDHADDLKLSNGVSFDELVGDNRWRQRGLINDQG